MEGGEQRHAEAALLHEEGQQEAASANPVTAKAGPELPRPYHASTPASASGTVALVACDMTVVRPAHSAPSAGLVTHS